MRDSVSTTDYENLDFSKALFSRSETEQLHFLRIPFKQKTLASDFIIVKTNGAGTIERGKIVHLEGGVNEYMEGAVKRSGFNGNISISSLDRSRVLTSPISNGHITAFHSNNTRVDVYGDDKLPEVVVVAYVSRGIDYSTWLWLSSLFYDSNTGGSGSGYYGSTGDGYSGGDGGYSSGSGGAGTGSVGDGSLPEENLMELEAEYIYGIPEIDVWKYFNCFDQVPSAGASFTVKLCVDIPSNNNPGASSTGSGSSAGHSFLTITKTNGNSTVTQSFGFYPKSEPSILDPFNSVPSSIKDNGGHEYNAAIEMNISESQFSIIRNIAISRSTLSYNLGNYNCTNYALDIFNAVKVPPVTVEPYTVVLPGNTDPYGPSQPNTVEIDESPQMLFTILQEMKSGSSTDAPKIEVDQTHGSLSPVSHGECN